VIIGLTGGIGAGKSMVSNQFAALGINIIDTDVIARQVVQPGTEALQKIIEHFGQSLLVENGALNRKALGSIIFSNPAEKTWLENLLHPLIYQEAIAQAKASTSAYCIIVIPLLFETKHHYPLDKIIVVDCPIEQQIARVEQRDHLSREMILAIIHQQVSREERLKNADEIIINDHNETKLMEQVNLLHKKILGAVK
jgi:dephospho-CoA kinase